MTDTLPELPDEDGDFTPNLARAIMEKYRELLAGRDAEIERLTREVAGYQETIRLSNAWDFPRDIQELSVRLEAAESSLSEAVKAEREACAKVADAKAIEFLSPEYATGQPFSSFNERFACGQVASAIRSRAAVLDSEKM